MMTRTNQEILDIFAKQIGVLNNAGISEIEIIERNLSGKVQYEIDGNFQQVLFVRFDAVLEPDLLYHVIQARTESLAITTSRISHLNCQEPIEQHNGQLTSSGDKCHHESDAQEEFRGVIVLQIEAAEEFLDGIQNDSSATMSDVLGSVCQSHEIRVERWSPTRIELHHKSGGGSYAKSDVVTRFRKEALPPFNLSEMV